MSAREQDYLYAILRALARAMDGAPRRGRADGKPQPGVRAALQDLASLLHRLHSCKRCRQPPAMTIPIARCRKSWLR